MEEKLLLSSSFLDSSLSPDIQPGEEIKEGKLGRRRRAKKARESSNNGEEAKKKRRLSEEQVKYLEAKFGEERKLESARKALLAGELGLHPKQVAVWFQNRRARWKAKHLHDQYATLKAAHDSILIDKCRLENEVLKLKERLAEAEEIIRKLSGSLNGTSVAETGCSPSSSFSTATQQPLLGEFGLENTDIMYVNEYNNYMEWANFYGM